MGRILAAYGGGFKPPTKGHFEVVLKTLEQFPEIEEFNVYVGNKTRDKITQEDSVKIWEIYKKYISIPFNVIPARSPIKDIINFSKDNSEDIIYFIMGKREDKEEDTEDIMKRSKGIEKKYSNIKIKVIETPNGGVSGTNARNSLLGGSEENFYIFLPTILSLEEKKQIFNIISNNVNESLNVVKNEEIKYWALFSHLFTKLKPDPDRVYKKLKPELTGEFGNALDYFYFTYFKDNESLIELLTENTTYSTYIDYKKEIAEVCNYLIKEGYNVQPLPKITFKHNNVENAKKFIDNKTGYYDPENKNIFLYTEGRHPRDLINSFCHEIVHHIQNMDGHLNNITTDNILEDDNLKVLEEEAYKLGGIILRSYKDSKKSQINEIRDLSTKTYNYEISRKTPYATAYEFKTDEKLIYKVEFIENFDKYTYEIGFYVVGEGPNFIANKGELYKVMATVVNIMNTFIKSNPEVSSIMFDPSKNYDGDDRRRNLYIKYIEHNIPTGWKVSPGDEGIIVLYKPKIQETNKQKDPFGLIQFARELVKEDEIIEEGIYDSIVRQIQNDVIKKWKRDGNSPKRKYSLLKKSYIFVDKKNRPLKFDLEAKLNFVSTEDNMFIVDGGAYHGDNEENSLIEIDFQIDPLTLPKLWEKIYFNLGDVLRHEIEHLTQEGLNSRNNKKTFDDDLDTIMRDLIDTGYLPKYLYQIIDAEIPAMLTGLYYKAKKLKEPFKDVVNNYLDLIEISPEEKLKVLDNWSKYTKKLSLPPILEEGTPELWTIYCDMDGVITDFDGRFEKFADIHPKKYEDSFGTDKFWKFIDNKVGIKFWANMEWVGDGKELWRYIKKYKPILLSSPSQNNNSKLGKKLWVKNNLPNTELILAERENKQNYADRSNILIDDNEKTIQEWESKGGLGILHKSAPQTIKILQKLGL